MFNTPIFMAQLLIGHGNFPEAEKYARQALSEDPQDGAAHAVLAEALAYQKKTREALKEVQQAIQLSPEDPHAHYVHSVILYQLRRWEDSKRAIHESIRLAPWNADYYGILSAYYFEEHDWNKALEVAGQGRSINPENEQCANMMAAALIKLNRKQEVEQVLGDTLERNPENDEAHANQGWARLYTGQYQSAMIHFREALRINPDNRSARNGILEALRARNPLYRIALRYFLWMSRMNTQARWVVVIGGLIFARVVRAIGLAVPSLEPFAIVLTFAYILFVIFTWIARPMTDLLLRLDQNGRLLLTKSQIQSTNMGLVLLALAGVFFASGLVGGNGTYFGAALGTLAMILPVFGSFQARSGSKRTTLLVYTLILALIGVGALAQALLGQTSSFDLASVFVLGWVAFSWVANIVASSR